MIDPGMEYIPPPRANLVARTKLRPAPPHIKREADSEDDEGLERDNDFEEPVGRGEGPSLSTGGGLERRRITHPEKADGAGGVSQTPRFTSLSLYEERMLLRRLDACPLALAVTPQAKRLHRKLLVRQAKRQRGLPLLDVDRAVSATLSLVGGIYGAQVTGTLVQGGVMGKYCTTSQELRILDRFQVPSTFILVLFSQSPDWFYPNLPTSCHVLAAYIQQVKATVGNIHENLLLLGFGSTVFNMAAVSQTFSFYS